MTAQIFILPVVWSERATSTGAVGIWRHLPADQRRNVVELWRARDALAFARLQEDLIRVGRSLERVDEAAREL